LIIYAIISYLALGLELSALCSKWCAKENIVFSRFYITGRRLIKLIKSFEYSLRHAPCHAHRWVAALLATHLWAWHGHGAAIYLATTLYIITNNGSHN